MKTRFYYGWVVVAVSFVTMGIGVNARTAFSLLFPPILKEFGWDRGVTAGAFSFGFFATALLTPLIGRLMDRAGPRIVLEVGVLAMGGGLLLAPLTQSPWWLYLTIGLLVGGGSVCIGYSGQSLFLPNWFVRRRGLAVGIAFSGVGLGSVTLLPAAQTLIDAYDWRTACLVLGGVLIVALAPINLLVRKRPEDIGLRPDGDAVQVQGATPAGAADRAILDPVWAAQDWTLARAARTARFWWLALGFFCALYVWYAIQVHQTKYLTELGYDAAAAAWALGLVSLAGVPGQIALGHLSDRIGREWVWAIACAGFVICYLALIAMRNDPSAWLLWTMVVAQGMLGYGLTSVLGAVVAEIFQGRHFGAIFGTTMLAGLIGGAVGPWATGVLYDLQGTYVPAFWIAVGISVLSAVAIWRAGPRQIRPVHGKRT